VTFLAVPQPYDFDVSTERFRAFGVDLANLWHEGGLHRVVDGREVRIEAAPGGVDVEPLDEATEPTVRKLLAFDFDLAPFHAFARDEPVLKRIVAAVPGLRPPLAPDPFEALVSSVTAQQVSLQSAFATRSRFIERFGRRAEHTYAFPTTVSVAPAREEDLTTLGFSRRKAEYVLGLARNPPDFEEMAMVPDEEVKTRIVSMRGFGEWSADWFLARYLARPHAWPAGDLGLVKAVTRFYPDATDVRALGERFDPFQNLTAHYLLTGSRVLA
jgi:DNA-3-methyladenine glycosylase II